VTWVVAAAGLNFGVMVGDSRISDGAGNPIDGVELVKFWGLQPETFVGFAGSITLAIDLVGILEGYTEALRLTPIEKFLNFFVKRAPVQRARGYGRNACELVILDMPNQRPVDPSPFRLFRTYRLALAASGKWDLDLLDGAGMGFSHIGSGATSPADLSRELRTVVSDFNSISCSDDLSAQTAALRAAQAVRKGIERYDREDVGGSSYYAVMSPWSVSAAPHRLGESSARVLNVRNFNQWLKERSELRTHEAMSFTA